MSGHLVSVMPTAPALTGTAGERASVRLLEFFASAIRNLHTRRAYARAAGDFLEWCAGAGVTSITAVQPLHVAAWIGPQTLSAPTVKQLLAAIRHLFDWLVTGQIAAQPGCLGARPQSHHEKGQDAGARRGRGAAAVRQHRCHDPIGLRDRALIALMVFRLRGWALRSRCASRTTMSSTNVCGCACGRRVASNSHCRVITRSRRTYMRTLTIRGSLTIEVV